MADPYLTLGLAPDADPADAEAAFRHLLKEAHPDRHVGAGAAEVADAERRTRELTAAIAQVRNGWRPSMRDPSTWHERHGFRPGADTDWFGNPATHDGASPAGTASRAATSTAPPTDRWRRFLRWLRFLPVPSFSLMIVLVTWWVLVIGLTQGPIERVGIWLGAVGFLVLRGLAHHAQRTRA